MRAARTRMRRSVARLAVLVGLLTVILIGQAGPASAACEGDPPTPSHPYGLLGLSQLGAPDWSKVPATAPNPFTDPNTRLVDVYGYGYQWGTYDLGCGVDIARDPSAVMFTKMANLGWTLPVAAAALLSASRELASWGPFDFLDPLLSSIQSSIKTDLWQVWFPISLLVVGLTVLLKARSAAYAATAQMLGWVALVVAVSAFFLQYPARADHLIGDGMTKVVHTASAPFGAVDADEQLSREVLYPQWLEGELGTSDSPTAQKYGPDLLWATHYTWSEEKQLRADPSSKERIDKAKADKFVATAKAVKNSDPGAYAYLTGHRSESRITAVTLAALFAWALALFGIIGFLLLALAQLMVRVFVIGFPLAGLVGVHPRGQFVLMRMWGLFTSAVLNAVKFGIATALFSIAASGTLKAPINGVAKIAALILLTVVTLVVAHPMRAFKTMIPGADPYHSYLMGGLKRAASFAVTRSAVASGVEAGADATQPDEETASQPVARRASRSEEYTMPPLPAPPDRRPSAELTASPIRHTAAELPAGPSIFASEPASDFDRQRSADVRPNPTQDALLMPPVSAPRPAEVRAVPVAPASVPVPSLTPVATADTRPGRAPIEGPAPSAPARSTPDVDLSAPLYSTRIDPRLYTSSDVTHGELQLSDTQVDDDGREVHVIYRRDGLDAQPA
jgi:hypothetical protein